MPDAASPGSRVFADAYQTRWRGTVKAADSGAGDGEQLRATDTTGPISPHIAHGPVPVSLRSKAGRLMQNYGSAASHLRLLRRSGAFPSTPSDRRLPNDRPLKDLRRSREYQQAWDAVRASEHDDAIRDCIQQRVQRERAR